MGEVSAFVAYGFNYHDCNDPETECPNALHLENESRVEETEDPPDRERARCEAVQQLVHGNAEAYKYVDASRFYQDQGVYCETPISVYIGIGKPTMSGGVLCVVPNRKAVSELETAFPGVRFGLIAGMEH